MAVATAIYPQGRTDTLYYTKDWKYAPNMTFADFYRVAYYPEDSLLAKQFRDYYLSGELQSNGYFTHLDSLDDANTIFEGECTSYFKNGNKESTRNYINGILQGDFFTYTEDGLIKQSGKYDNGKLTGLLTEFLDNETYIQIEYLDGIPIHNYYVMGDSQGNLSKFKLSDNSPIWESPTIDERITDYKDGVAWQYYNKNGIIISLNSTAVKDYGKWHRVELVISNNSINPIEFDPVVNIQANSTDKDSIMTYLDIWSCEQYMKKVNNAHIWASVLMGVAEGMSTANAGYSTYTTSSNNYRYGSYTGSTVSITRSYNASEAYQARVLSQQRMENFNNAMHEEKQIKKMGYLKRNTIYPGETISGYVHIKRVKGNILDIKINIEGAEYCFNWSFGK